MTSLRTPPNQELVYRLIYERQWASLLDLVHRHHIAVAGDALLTRAVETFVTAFLQALDPEGDDPAGDALEKLFLLHSGGFYRLPGPAFEQVVVRLVQLHRDRPEAALGYARFCPDHPDCADVIERHADAHRTPVDHTQADTIELARSRPLRDADHTISLFKSEQEVAFFRAVRDVFATYLVYPNVALRCLVDFEALKERLSAEERQYFFHALIDCVVFDQHDRYRPCFFFELDSTLHDTPSQAAKDRRKDRILALAGQKLYRIRKRDRRAGRPAFVQLIREIVTQEAGSREKPNL